MQRAAADANNRRHVPLIGAGGLKEDALARRVAVQTFAHRARSLINQQRAVPRQQQRVLDARLIELQRN